MSGYKGNKGRESEDRRSRARNEEREPCVTGGEETERHSGEIAKNFSNDKESFFLGRGRKERTASI